MGTVLIHRFSFLGDSQTNKSAGISNDVHYLVPDRPIVYDNLPSSPYTKEPLSSTGVNKFFSPLFLYSFVKYMFLH